MNPTLNLWAVVVSAIASMVIGSIWYGPLFGKKYMAATGMDMLSVEQQEKMKKGVAKMYILQFIGSLVMFYVLAGVIVWFGELTAGGGAAIAFWMWLGFVVPLKLSDMLWGGKMSLFWLGIGNMLVTLLAAGAIIGAMH